MGFAILESYSRVLESLANTVFSRIEDVLYADSMTQNPSLPVSKMKSLKDSSPGQRLSSAEDEFERPTPVGSPNSMTLSDFMGWNFEGADADMKMNNSTGNIEKESEVKIMSKPANIATKKRFSYLDKLEWSGLRSPTSRH